jgi:hypothetical protein
MNAAQRMALRDTMKLLVDHEPQVNYPFKDIRGAKDAATFRLTGAQMRAALKAGKHLMMDCSQGVTCLFKWAGLEDPNGHSYRDAGFTGTLLHHLPRHPDPSKARVGALVVYGPATGEHVSMVFSPGKDPLLWSHGFDGGPQLIRLSRQRQSHHLPVTFLDISGIGPA